MLAELSASAMLPVQDRQKVYHFRECRDVPVCSCWKPCSLGEGRNQHVGQWQSHTVPHQLYHRLVPCVRSDCYSNSIGESNVTKIKGISTQLLYFTVVRSQYCRPLGSYVLPLLEHIKQHDCSTGFTTLATVVPIPTGVTYGNKPAGNRLPY
jgi:hypothetical protein